MTVRAVLFDFGHTLVDFSRTEDALRGAYTVIRERLATWVEDRAPPEVDELVERIADEIDRMVERSYQERRLEELDQIALFADAFAAIGYELPQDLLREVAELDHEALARSLVVEPDTIEVLGKLRADGYRLGLVSNVSLLPHMMRRDLDNLGLSPLLDGIAFSSEVGVRKPRPKIFQTVLDQVGVPAAETVFVGDRLTDDVAGAHAIGMRAILCRRYRQEEPDEDLQPEAVIERITELPDILASWRQ